MVCNGMSNVLWLVAIAAAIGLMTRKRTPSDSAIAKGLAVTAQNLLENQRRVRGVLAMPSATVDASLKCLNVVFADLRMTPEEWARKSDKARDEYTHQACRSFCEGLMQSDFHCAAAKQGWGVMVTFQTGEGMHMSTEHISARSLVSSMSAVQTVTQFNA